jgi:hypothetical protein
MRAETLVIVGADGGVHGHGVALARRRVRGELWREEESTTVATMAHVCTLSRRLVLRTYSVPKSRPEVH